MTGRGSDVRDPVRIALLYPELLGTYGDGGNAVILARRLQWRGFATEVVTVGVGQPAPASCDIYLMGGGEDGPQALAVEDLRTAAVLGPAVERGAAVFAVCAGFQLLGREFAGAGGQARTGLGLLDCTTRRGSGPRRVGELLVDPDPALGLPPLSGYENHACVTALGPDARALGRVLAGHGNGEAEEPSRAPTSAKREGAIAGRVVGTYLHGPALARNPALADLILSWIVGPLPALDDAEVDALRRERLAAVDRPANPLRRWKTRVRR